MLTADLVPVRRKNGKLQLTPIVGKSFEQHLELAEQVMAVVTDCVGMTREQLHAEFATIGHTPAEIRIVKGFAKLVEDALVFEEDRGAKAAQQRRAVFERAADAWKGLALGATFDRNAVLANAAEESGASAKQLEDELFIDLPAAQRILESLTWSPEDLVRRYDEGRIAAILLRAVTVKARLPVRSAMQIRALLRVLKFHRLLFELERETETIYTLTISGPYSLFDAVTKYGLKLALCWPALSSLPGVEVEAELRWGKQNERLTFEWSAKGSSKSVKGVELPPAGDPEEDAQSASEEVSELQLGLTNALPSVRISAASVLLDMPGVGLCVPDLECQFESGAVVYVEVLGFWSRQAVWRRIELVEAGLLEPVLFVVSSKLRVSEELLDENDSSALYVFKGRINASAAAARLSALAARVAPQPPRKRGKRPQK